MGILSDYELNKHLKSFLISYIRKLGCNIETSGKTKKELIRIIKKSSLYTEYRKLCDEMIETPDTNLTDEQQDVFILYFYL